MLINQWLLPAPERSRNTHFVLCLRGEACDLLTGNDGFPGFRVDDSREDSWAVAAWWGMLGVTLEGGDPIGGRGLTP